MKILIIDSSYLMYKSYFAFSGNHLSVNKDGQEIITSSIFGFLRELLTLSNEMKYNYIITEYDTPPYIKKKKYPSYKESRDNNLPPFIDEREILKAILFDMNIPCIYAKGYEGEEVAKSVIKKLKNNGKIDLYTNDEDCFALLSNRVNLIKTVRGEIIITSKKELKAKYNVTPKQFKTFKILTGCSSDCVKGVNGIGPVKASEIVNQFPKLKDILKNLDQLPEKTREKIMKAKQEGVLSSAKYLTKIQAPRNLELHEPEIRIPYNRILEFLEAESFLKGTNKLLLKHVKKQQTKNDLLGQVIN